MIWLPLTLATAACESTRDILSKRHLGEMDDAALVLGLNLSALLLLAPVALLVGIPRIEPAFWIALLAAGTLNAAGILLYMRAIRLSDLSVTVPLTSFTPLFVLVLASVTLGERPGAGGIAGVALIVAGAYVLRSDERGGVLAPLRALVRDSGPRLMLMAAVLFSVTSTLDKVGVRNSSASTWSAAMHAIGALAILPVVAWRHRRRRFRLTRGLLPVGLLSGLGHLSQMTALGTAMVAYVNALKRVGIASTVVAGGVLFRERGLRRRLAGAALMALGAGCTAIAGMPRSVPTASIEHKLGVSQVEVQRALRSLRRRQHQDPVAVARGVLARRGEVAAALVGQ